MTKCWFCGSEEGMVWSGDFSFEDYGMEGEGVIAVLICPNPNCGATAEFTTAPIEENTYEN